MENCVCVLHNLSFQLESEAPALFSRITALAGTISRANASAETGPIGCFSQQSSKVQEQEVRQAYRSNDIKGERREMGGNCT
jgi:hypothetical protein